MKILKKIVLLYYLDLFIFLMNQVFSGNWFFFIEFIYKKTFRVIFKQHMRETNKKLLRKYLNIKYTIFYYI